jgi:hypothetical protein
MDGCLPSQNTYNILINPRINCRDDKILPLDVILGELNPLHTHTSNFFKIQVLPSSLRYGIRTYLIFLCVLHFAHESLTLF